MTRFKQILAGAAVLVVTGGLFLADALKQSAETEVGQNLSCAQWRRGYLELGGGRYHSAYFGIRDGLGGIPEAIKNPNRTIGTCAGGTCEVNVTGCPDPVVSYTYRRSQTIGASDWRLVRVYAPLYFLASIKSLADQSASVVFLGGEKETKAQCLAHFTAAQCLQAFSEVLVAWKKADGKLCVNGALLGSEDNPGGGGVTCSTPDNCAPDTCTLAAGDTPYPDVASSKDEPEQSIARDFYTNTELGLD